jgi:hypothetical protein
MEDIPMFVIYPENAADWQHAVFMLSYYHVKIEAFSDGEDSESAYIIVRGDDEQLRLAEMAFQMNWHQGGIKCRHCSDDLDTCGHLTFTSRIDSSAFDAIFGE